MPDFEPLVYRDGSHTCIVFERTAKAVKFVSIEALELSTAAPAVFDKTWEPYPLYPVKRAAEKYLLSVQYRTIPAKVHELLGSIAAQAADYAMFDVLKSTKPKGNEMARKPANGLNSVVDGATKPRAAKPVKAVKAEPAAKPVKAVKAEPAAKAPDTTKYKIGDVSSVKRGFLAEFVEKAQSLKQFTRDALEAEFGGRYGSPEAQKVGTYFPYAVGKGIFVSVK